MIKLVLKHPAEEPTEVPIHSVNDEMIYACACDGCVYKLQKIRSHYGFCSLHNSSRTGFGWRGDVEEAILSVSWDVYEFDNALEFLLWAEERIKK